MQKKIKDEIISMMVTDKKLKDKKLEFNNGLEVENKDVLNLQRKNTKRLKEIIKDYGFPTISLVGKDGNDAVFHLVHSSTEDIKFASKIYKQLSKLPKSEINLKEYAIFEDTLNYYVRKPQVYGTKYYYNLEGFYVPWELYDKKNVNRFRKSIGFDSLDLKLKEKNIPQDKAYEINKKLEDKLVKIGWLKEEHRITKKS